MKTFCTSLKIFLLFTVLTGIIYPLLITSIAQIFFHEKANGSIIKDKKIIIGSKLIGQHFDSPIYFHPRPSATDYNTLPSGGSNMSITNLRLKEAVGKRKSDFITENNIDTLTDIPSEMVFASASGLDPHISPEAALLQVNRISAARDFDLLRKEKLIQLIKLQTEAPRLSFTGTKKINVLLLNLEVDKIK